MGLSFAGMRTRMSAHLGIEDTVNSAISTTDRDALINEAYLEYFAEFGVPFVLTSEVTSAGSTFNMGIASEGFVMELMALEIQQGARWAPLVGDDYWRIFHIQKTEGMIGTPRSYGAAFNLRDQTNGYSRWAAAVYPAPSGAFTYRGTVRVLCVELTNSSDNTQLDQSACDAVCRIAALRGGLLLGYDAGWASNLVASIPQQVAQRMALDDLLRYQQYPADQVPAVGRGIG